MSSAPMHSSTALPDDLREFIDSCHWTFSKTMPEWPHEYIVRDQVDEELFVRLVCHIRENGYEGKFYQKTLIYFEHDGMAYWTMGAPLAETTIINRCLKENTYEHRLQNDTLSESSYRPKSSTRSDIDRPLIQGFQKKWSQIVTTSIKDRLRCAVYEGIFD